MLENLGMSVLQIDFNIEALSAYLFCAKYFNKKIPYVRREPCIANRIFKIPFWLHLNITSFVFLDICPTLARMNTFCTKERRKEVLDIQHVGFVFLFAYPERCLEFVAQKCISSTFFLYSLNKINLAVLPFRM